jgi:hypothetical protein
MAQVIRLTHDELMQEQAACRVYQERYEPAFTPWNRTAPAPPVGMSPNKYRRQLMEMAQQYISPYSEFKSLRDIPVATVSFDVLSRFEPQFMEACRSSAKDPRTVPPGEFREVPVTDRNGMTIKTFIGQESFVKGFTRPCRRVKSFNTSHGKVVYTDPKGNVLL